MGKLDGKIALITGGTSGMGEAFARLFATEGAEVVIVGRSSERGEAIVSDVIADGGKAYFIYADVTDIESIDQLYKKYVELHDHLDILVNNAGVLLTSPLEDMDETDWMTLFDTNIHATMRVTKAFIDLVIKCHGNILNNTSNVGLHSYNSGRNNLGYSASKAAAIKFTEQCALNYTPVGVRVNCLCPGTTDTPIFTNRDFSRFTNFIPMKRVGKVDEIAKAALFLVSDDASYISGAVLTVDGGASLM